MANVPDSLPVGHEAHARPCRRCGRSDVRWHVVAVPTFPNGKGWRLYNADGTEHGCVGANLPTGEDGPTTTAPENTAERDRIHALKRPALRSEYVTRFPSDRTRSQYLPMDAMRAALLSGEQAPVDAAPNAPSMSVNVSPESGGDAAALAALIQRLAAGALDETRARTIAREEAERAAARIANGRSMLEVVASGQTIGKVDGPTHVLLPKIVSALAAGCHVFLYGAAGGGKTTVARQAAQALTRPFFQLSVGPDTRGMRLVGYRSPTSGEYVVGPFRTYSGMPSVVLLDEIDTAHPSVLPEVNALLANGHYTWADDTETEIHPDFRVIAGANTIGRGADGVYMRNPIDGASLDRFVFIEFTYDEDLERAIIGAPSRGTSQTAKTYKPRTLSDADRGAWHDRVCAFRNAVTAAKVRMIVSPRATIYGARLLSAGWSRTEVEDAVIWRGAGQDDRSRVLAAMR